MSGRPDQARRHARRGLELSRQVVRPIWEAYGLIGLGAAVVLQGDHAQAQDRLSQAQAVLRRHGLERTLPDLPLRRWRELSAYASGDLETAQATAAKIVQIGRGGGSRWDESNGEWLLGGDLDEAWELAHDSLEVLDDYGDRVGAAAGLETIAELAVALGEPERSLRLLAATERLHTESGIARFPLEADRFGRARDAAHATLADPDATTCWEAGGELSLEEAVASARRGRGERQRPQVGWASLTPVESSEPVRQRPAAQDHPVGWCSARSDPPRLRHRRDRSGATTMTADRIHRAISTDGTEIAGGVHGQGPPLVLFHGLPEDGDIT